ncbi:helix-turn-helix transcriptional regulator [Roseibium litorale]|uniref:Helix-turn-helix domain-containing protein n=1 Tax=Roseibium litorale TaxID=2803841 RepID=A0ABR9CSZ9_9HYPH|nr:helix-turn-helix domain-containing protein [Roseibium litorale]MBD8893975.1 helix-turn-helix domain-containing protein [Roseibium litorale]
MTFRSVDDGLILPSKQRMLAPLQPKMNPFRSITSSTRASVCYRRDMMAQSEKQLTARLLSGLAEFRSAHAPGMLTHAHNLFSYCSLDKERLTAIRLPHPVLGIVVSGTKEVWLGDDSAEFNEGALFVLPGHISMDVLNVPSERRGFYRSLIVQVEPDALSGLKTRHTQVPRPQFPSPPLSSISLTPQLVNAIVHAASDIAHSPLGPTIRSSRLTELLALLAEDPAAAPLFDRSVSDRLAQLLSEDLSHSWTATEAAERLGLSESTLRRRLSGGNSSFRSLLRKARMTAARRLLETGYSSQDAAYAVGYVSRTHFARHFKAAFGVNPSDLGRLPQGGLPRQTQEPVQQL